MIASDADDERRNGMTAAEFRAAGHAPVDWVADHLDGLRDLPVAPATTELEAQLLDRLVDELGLPTAWRNSGPGGGVLQHSASDSTHVALVIARERAAQEHGARPGDCVAYSSAPPARRGVRRP